MIRIATVSLLLVSLTTRPTSFANTIHQMSSQPQLVSAEAGTAPVYDCLLAASHAASAITGNQVKNMQSHYDGYAGTTSAGSVYVEMPSCYIGSKATAVEFTWTDKRIPLELSFPTGAIRSVRVTDNDSHVTMRIVDERGRSASLTPVKIPTSIVCYLQAGSQDVFYNFDQPTRADRSLTVIAIVDTKVGPSLRSEDVP